MVLEAVPLTNLHGKIIAHPLCIYKTVHFSFEDPSQAYVFVINYPIFI